MEHVSLLSESLPSIFWKSTRIDKKFVNPIRIEHWAVVVFESPRRVPEMKIQDMIKDYIGACNTIGE